MAGSLYHSRKFKTIPYVGNDGLPHHEVVPIDGDIEVVSISTWKELKDYCQSRGASPTVWPEFPTFFDIPLDKARSHCQELSPMLETLPTHEVADMPWLEKLLTYVQREEVFFFVYE